MRNFKQYFFTNLPLINFFVSSTALTFQITILNPWHSTISKQFNELNKKITDQNTKVS